MSLGGPYQHLGHDREQALREEALGLLALLYRQRVDHAIDRLDRAGGVERAEHQVPGLRRGHRHGDGVGIAQLTDQDDVGVLAHRGAHAFGEARDVRAELALDHLAVLARVHELDRVLEADDVEPARLVQVIDHRRERGRFAGTGGAGDQHHALVEVAELGDDRRQRQLLERRDLGGDGAEGGADAGVLAIDVDPKAPPLAGYVGEVQVVALGEMLVLRAGEDLRYVALELRRAHVAELDRQQIAVHAQHGGHADRQVHVRAPLLCAELQKRVDARQANVPPGAPAKRCLARKGLQDQQLVAGNLTERTNFGKAHAGCPAGPGGVRPHRRPPPGGSAQFRKRSSAARSSSIVWKRLVLSTAIARMTSSASPGGSEGFTSWGGRALPCTC